MAMRASSTRELMESLRYAWHMSDAARSAGGQAPGKDGAVAGVPGVALHGQRVVRAPLSGGVPPAVSRLACAASAVTTAPARSTGSSKALTWVVSVVVARRADLRVPGFS